MYNVSIRVYVCNQNNLNFVLVQLDGIPRAVAPFQGKLLVGCGNALRIYDLGKKKLLRKCENKSFPTAIVSIHTQVMQICVPYTRMRCKFVDMLFVYVRISSGFVSVVLCLLDSKICLL